MTPKHKPLKIIEEIGKDRQKERWPHVVLFFVWVLAILKLHDIILWALSIEPLKKVKETIQ